jgi:beta-lactamase class A
MLHFVPRKSINQADLSSFGSSRSFRHSRHLNRHYKGHKVLEFNWSRRGFVQICASSALFGCAPTIKKSPTTATAFAASLALGELERRSGGKLGVNFLVPSTGASLSLQGDERFGMASSFKLALAAVILREADQGRLSLTTQLPISQADIVSHAPVVRENLANGSMSIQALAQAAQTTSDNAATNILLRQLGGPSVLTQNLRDMGDTTTRVDRMEPEMNRVVPGDPRDTTTPNAMAQTIGKMVLGDYLSPTAKVLLAEWMVATRTGTKRIRAGLPTSWRSGDKTGTATGFAPELGIPDRYNDIAVAWPPIGPPMVIAAYYQSPVLSQNMRDQDQAVLAAVGTIAASWYASLS